MRTKKIDTIQYIFIVVIVLLSALFIYIIFFLMPETTMMENRNINVVTDTVNYQDYVFQQKLVQIYQDVSNTQHNHYTWLLIFFLGFVAIMLLVFISTVNKLLGFIMKDKSNINNETNNQNILNRLKNLESKIEEK